jgi:15-cis-phytoene synthase
MSPALATLRRHGRSFAWASRLLPAELREDVALLYAFCRRLDDLADRSPAAEAIPRLRRIREDLAAGRGDVPEVAEFLDLAARRGLPTAAAQHLAATLEADCAGLTIGSEADLIRYAYGVAGVVGLLMCPLLGGREPAAQPFAIDLGIAMQLTNIARDVLEDADRGRLYLPPDLLPSPPLLLPVLPQVAPPVVPPAVPWSAAALLGGDPAARAAAWGGVERLLALAERYYRSGEAGLVWLPPRVRPGIAAAAQVYRGIGRRILERGPQDYWTGRAVVPWHGKLGHTLAALGETFGGALLHPAGGPPPRHDAHLHRHLHGLPGADVP